MEPCSYVKGSCGSDFAVFFIPAGNESKSCLRDLDAVDISVAGGDNIFNGKQEVKRQSMRL